MTKPFLAEFQLAAAPRVPPTAGSGKPPATYTYDLVDVGREVLQQLTIPLSLNFSAALRAPTIRQPVRFESTF